MGLSGGVVGDLVEVEARAPMRVLISAGTYGGAGGAQRALASILRALPDDEVDVVARRVVGDPKDRVAQPASNLHWRWKGSDSRSGLNSRVASLIANPIRRRVFPRYDIYLRLFQGADLSHAVRADLRLLVPSGNVIPAEIASRYDYVAMQAPDNTRFLSSQTPRTLLRPPLYPLADQAHPPPVALPDRFLLTAFNPYGEVKGTDDLARVADRIPVPMVWCHSADSLSFDIPESLRDHPSVIHIESPAPAELRYLYERCEAYVCFSVTEGFGWSIADGLRHSPVVVSRRIGILSNDEAMNEQVRLVDDRWDVDWEDVLHQAASGPRGRDLSWHSATAFREQLVQLHRDRVESR